MEGWFGREVDYLDQFGLVAPNIKRSRKRLAVLDKNRELHVAVEGDNDVRVAMLGAVRNPFLAV